MSQVKSTLITLTLFLSACMVLGTLAYVPEREIRETFNQILAVFGIVAKLVIVAFGLFFVGLLAWWAWIGFWAAMGFLNRTRFKARMRNAIALKKERDASVIITVGKPGAPAWITEIAGSGLDIITRPLHLEAAPELAARWNTFQIAQSISKRQQQQLPELAPQIAAPLPDRVDLSHYVNGTTSIRNIFLGVGRFPDGRVQPVSAPLHQLVHIAVGGSSGFGKSYFEQALAYQVVSAREYVQPVLLDAQAVTFTVFGGDERLLFPLASEPAAIRLILAELVKIMAERHGLFSQWRGVQNLEQYNRVADAPLSTIPVFFDEFGLLAKDKVIAKSVDDLAKGGRKCGMYLVAGAQTWYADEIAGSLKANLSTAVQFYARSKSQSRVLLEDSAAAEITRKGQAFCRLPGQVGLIELQAPDVSHILDVEPVRVGVHPEPVEGREQVIELEPEESGDDLFIRLVEEGRSRSEASMEAYGKAYAGTSHVNHCRRLLGEM